MYSSFDMWCFIAEIAVMFLKTMTSDKRYRSLVMPRLSEFVYSVPVDVRWDVYVYVEQEMRGFIEHLDPHYRDLFNEFLDMMRRDVDKETKSVREEVNKCHGN